MSALFATSEILPPPPREHADRRRVREKDESRERKMELREMEAARRASIANEEACKIKVVESIARAYSSRDVEKAVLLMRALLRVSRLQR